MLFLLAAMGHHAILVAEQAGYKVMSNNRVFRDRRDAGRFRAGLLGQYRCRPDVLVLGLSRGGVPVAYEVAKNRGAPLDVFVVRRLGCGPGGTGDGRDRQRRGAGSGHFEESYV